MIESGNGSRNVDEKFVIHKPQQLKNKKMLNTFCKRYSKAEEIFFVTKVFTCSLVKASIDILPTNSAYFQSLVSNCSTLVYQLHYLVGCLC